MTDAGPPPSDPDADVPTRRRCRPDAVDCAEHRTCDAPAGNPTFRRAGHRPARGYEPNAFPQGTFGPSGQRTRLRSRPSQRDLRLSTAPTYANPLMAHKPGVVPLRPLTAADILSGSFAAITTNFRTVAPISAAFAIVSAAIGLLVSAMAQSVAITDDTTRSASRPSAPPRQCSSPPCSPARWRIRPAAPSSRYPPLKRSWGA